MVIWRVEKEKFRSYIRRQTTLPPIGRNANFDRAGGLNSSRAWASPTKAPLA